MQSKSDTQSVDSTTGMVSVQGGSWGLYKEGKRYNKFDRRKEQGICAKL